MIFESGTPSAIADENRNRGLNDRELITEVRMTATAVYATVQTPQLVSSTEEIASATAGLRSTVLNCRIEHKTTNDIDS